MEPIDLAYLAALIEGEGCLFVSRTSIPSGTQYYAGLSLQIGEEEIARWFADVFQSPCTLGSPKNPGNRPLWRVHCHADSILEILPQVAPLFKSWRNQQQARFVLKMLGTMAPGKTSLATLKYRNWIWERDQEVE